MLIELRSLDALRSAVATWRGQGESVALVPTMGALHAGHLHLVREAKKHAARVVVSIFVNPTQFGPNEDFSRYPRPLSRDLELLSEVGADAAWLPDVATMYPNGFATSIHVSGVSEGLCGAVRPGHFDGVATVVAKLLLQVAPDVALFGEKDYQQLCVIKRLVNDLNINTNILGVPTVREADGLALSSRNQYLSESERKIAPKLHQILEDTGSQLVIPAKAGILSDEKDSRLRGNDETTKLLAQAKKKILAEGFASIDYLELRAEDTLAPLAHYAPPARLLVAARLGSTRLIDNIRVG